MGMGGQHHAPAALHPGKRPDADCIGAWAGPGPVWTGTENLHPSGIRSPDRPFRSESLYRLRYTGPQIDSDPNYSENSTGSRHFSRCDTLSGGQILQFGTVHRSWYSQSLCFVRMLQGSAWNISSFLSWKRLVKSGKE